MLLQLGWHFLRLMKWRYWRLTMIELKPLTSALHVSYDLTAWRDSTIPIHCAKPKGTQEVRSAHDSRSGMVTGKPKIFHRRKKILLFIGLTYLSQKDFPSDNHKAWFPMKQGHCFPFSTPLRSDPNLKDQPTKFGWVVAPSLLHSPSSLCSMLFPQRMLLNMFC